MQICGCGKRTKKGVLACSRGEDNGGNLFELSISKPKAFQCVDHKKLWDILKEMGISDHLTASWETCMQDRKQQLKLDMEQWIGSKYGKSETKLYIVTLFI